MIRPLAPRPNLYRRAADTGVRDFFWRGELFLLAHIVVGTAVAFALAPFVGGAAVIAALAVYVAAPIALVHARMRPLP